MVLAGKLPAYAVVRDSETGRVFTSAAGEHIIDQGHQRILGTVDGKVRGLCMSVAQIRKSLTSVCDMCATGQRVVSDFDKNNNDDVRLTGEKTYFKLRNRVWELEIKVIEDGDRCDLVQGAETTCRRVVPFRGEGSSAVSPLESRADLGPERVGEEQEGQSIMAESDHDPVREPGAIRARAVPVRPTRQKREDHEVAGHVPYRSWCRACVAGRGRCDAYLTHRIPTSTTKTIGIDYGYLKDIVTLGEQEAGPSPILLTRPSTTQMTTADALPCKGPAHPWCVQALVRATVRTRDAEIILRSDNEPAILDLKRQAAAECRVKHGMTVILDNTTEYDSQSNGLAELAVRDVKGVARSMRVALRELYKTEISSKHPVLPWLVSYATGQITRGQIGSDGKTPHQRLKGRTIRKLLSVFAEHVLCLPIGKGASRLPERWSDGLFLGVFERSSEFYIGTAQDVVRTRSLRRRPLEERASPELLDKLVGVPWQRAPGERKNVELRCYRYTRGCGCDAARLDAV